MQQAHAIIPAADEANSPAILQGYAGARKFTGEVFATFGAVGSGVACAELV